MRQDSGWTFWWFLLWGLIFALGLPVGRLEKEGSLEPPIAFAQAQKQNPSQAGGAVPPFNLKDEAVIKEGAVLFATRCTGYCHGKEGGPARAPKLRGRDFDQDRLFQTISNGVVVMPAWRGILSDEEIWKIVAYILSLSHVED